MADKEDMADKEQVGVVGIGRMGLSMAKHLIRHGYPVTACDLNTKQCELARSAGAVIAATPGDVGKAARFVIIGVGYDDEVQSVMSGSNGLLATMPSGSVIAVSSTCAPEFVKKMDEQARLKGIDIFDAPICRGAKAADDGTLLGLVGAKPGVFARGEPIYRTFCSDLSHLGPVGAGQVGKAMNNFLLWVNGIALIEAGRLSEANGMDLLKLRDALLMSSGASDALKSWDNVTFTWALKDMQIVMKMCDQAGLSLPIAGAIKELVKEGRRIKASNAPDWTGKRAK
jgi:3-hydroxyisobutyrate dehydrogenase-like beta-hydroxyacid dehydrogenase